MPALDTTRHTYTLRSGKAFDYWLMTRARGRKYLLGIGYEIKNHKPDYLTKGDEVVFWNRYTKVWKTDVYTPDAK